MLLIIGLHTFKGAAQTQSHIIAFDKSGVLVWTNVLAGHYYSIQAKASLSGAWTNLSGGLDNLQATGSIMVVKVPVQTSQAFYTVVDRGSCCQNTGGDSLVTASDLASICGDQSGTNFSVSGCGNGWFKIQVSECMILSHIDLACNIFLQSPVGAAYDLYVYRDGVPIHGAPAGPNLEEVLTSQTDTSGNNSYQLIIEVRRVDAYPCINWTLQFSVP